MNEQNFRASHWALPRADDENPVLLSTLPPSEKQVRLALGVAAALLVAFAVTIPFVNTQLPRVDAFIPVLETAIIINDLITSALLFAQFSVTRRPALLVLASGFLYTALIVIPHMLSFPGAFAPGGVIGGGTQTTAMLYYFWHIGSPMAVIAYVFLNNLDDKTSLSQRSPSVAIGWSVASTIVLVCALTWIATSKNSLMPTIFIDGVKMNAVPHLVGGLLLAFLTATALALLWFKRRTVLDLWLLVMCCAWLVEVTINAFLSGRFNLGWYASRIYDLTGTIFVLLVLLSETTTLYARLAQSMMRQRREHQNRVRTMDSVTASIAHEVNQPLTSIVTRGEAAMLWLEREPPKLDDARKSIAVVISEANRAAKVIQSIRGMFKEGDKEKSSFNLNHIIEAGVAHLADEFRIHGVSIEVELQNNLPKVTGNPIQLRQVILNLMMNALDAMSTTAGRTKVLRVRSGFQEPNGVLALIEDSGVGIAPGNIEHIFEPFFTTKSNGMGMGLWICRSAVEAHGGRLSVTPAHPHGSVFQIVLPVERSDNG